MPTPTVDQDPEKLAEAERARRKIVRLPGTLDAAFAALEADATARAFLPEPLLPPTGGQTCRVRAPQAGRRRNSARRYAEVY